MGGYGSPRAEVLAGSIQHALKRTYRHLRSRFSQSLMTKRTVRYASRAPRRSTFATDYRIPTDHVEVAMCNDNQLLTVRVCDDGKASGRRLSSRRKGPGTGAYRGCAKGPAQLLRN